MDFLFHFAKYFITAGYSGSKFDGLRYIIYSHFSVNIFKSYFLQIYNFANNNLVNIKVSWSPSIECKQWIIDQKVIAVAVVVTVNVVVVCQ